MESIEKLRELNTFGSVKVDGDLVTTNMLMVCATKEEINEIADEIEAEIESRYMELPVDADGVPIRCGDVMTHKLGTGERKDTVEAVYENGFLSYRSDGYWHHMAGDTFVHVNPRTIEDVLRDLVDGIDSVEFDALTAIGEAADEIRELMEVDE